MSKRAAASPERRIVEPPELSPEEVEARFRWARAQGHPEYLWPDVPPAEWRAALDDLAGATAAVLNDPDGLARFSELDDDRVRARGLAGYTSGMGPLLGHWLERGRIKAGEATEAMLRTHLEHSRGRTERLDHELARVLGVLGTAGIRATVIKGAYTAREYFPEPAARPGADLDIVVPRETMPAAETALAEAGYTLRQRTAYSGRADWWPPGVRHTPRTLEMVHADDPYAIDLQSSFARYFGSREPVDVVGGRREHMQAWDRVDGAADVLVQPTLTAHLALHASEKFRNLTLIRLVELVIVVRRDAAAGSLRWNELYDLLDRTGALPFVYPAFELAQKLAPGTIDADFRAAVRDAAPRRPVRLVEGMRPGQAPENERTSVEEYFLWARGPVDHVRRALRILWPPMARGSMRALVRLYVRRLYRLVRLRVRLRRGAGHDS